jgi:hypothetical protein
MNARRARAVRSIARKYTTLFTDTLRMQTTSRDTVSGKPTVTRRYYHEVGSYRRNVKIVKKFLQVNKVLPV